MDLRVGGEVRVVMRNPHEDVRYGGGGEYTEIDPPRRLVFTWTWDDDQDRVRPADRDRLRGERRATKVRLHQQRPVGRGVGGLPRGRLGRGPRQPRARAGGVTAGPGHGTEVWSSPGWRAAAESWLDEQLAAAGIERTGEVEQPHLRPWATVLKAPTPAGPRLVQGRGAWNGVRGGALRASARGRSGPRARPDRNRREPGLDGASRRRCSPRRGRAAEPSSSMRSEPRWPSTGSCSASSRRTRTASWRSV